MHVSLEHVEEGKHFYLNAAITFSESEKHIIRTRNLENLPIIAGAVVPPPSLFKALSPALATIAPLLMIVGFFGGLASGLANYGPGSIIGGLLFWGGIPLWIWSYIGNRVIEKKHGEKIYTVGAVLRDPNIRIVSDTPVKIKLLDNELRENLQNVKKYIEASETLANKQSFEI